MKRLLTILSILFLCITSDAQNLAIGERTPPMHLKFRHWVHERIPSETEYTYIGFVHSASVPCLTGIDHIRNIIGNRSDIGMIFITKESVGEISASLSRMADDRSSVACDCEYLFRSFGVNYAPFGVIVDRKRRALWFGNPKQLTADQIVKLTTKTNKKCRSQR